MSQNNKTAAFTLKLLGYDLVQSKNLRTDLRWHVTRQNGKEVFELVCRSPVEALAYFERGKIPREYYVRTTKV